VLKGNPFEPPSTVCSFARDERVKQVSDWKDGDAYERTAEI
jgi:hypothetical protein